MGEEFGSDPVQAFPGHGQMKPEQLEIERLRREVNKLRAERDIRAERMRSIIRACLGFERIVNRGTQFDPIINNVRKALEEIAAESKLNARRVAKFIGPPPAIPEDAELVAEVESREVSD